LSRFPLTPDGWESAWRALAELDAGAATEVSAILAALAERHRLAELDSDSVQVRSVTYDGGSGDAPLTPGQAYDLRFLGDRLTICLPGTKTAMTEMAYHDVLAADIERSDRGRSGGETIAVVLAAALAGALIGFRIRGLLGLSLGAILFGLIAAAAMASANPTKAIVLLRGQDSEFFFSKAGLDSDALRIQLSRPLLAIAGPRADGDVSEQLTRLAALLADGLLLREEFEELKARIIARP
jgi:hypothetical protein